MLSNDAAREPRRAQGLPHKRTQCARAITGSDLLRARPARESQDLHLALDEVVNLEDLGLARISLTRKLPSVPKQMW